MNSRLWYIKTIINFVSNETEIVVHTFNNKPVTVNHNSL